MAEVIPGDYVFEITATVGATQSSVQFTLTLDDPCDDQVSLVFAAPAFQNVSYELGAAESNQLWQPNTLITEDTWISCGPITFEFYLNDGSYTSLDPLIFKDDRSKDPYEFKFLHTTNFDHVGSYEIVCVAYYANY